MPFLHRLINRLGITAINTATYMRLIGYNVFDVSCLRALQLSSRPILRCILTFCKGSGLSGTRVLRHKAGQVERGEILLVDYIML